MDTDGSSAATLGARLAGQAGRLRLLVAHFAGRAVLARVDAEDLVQEVYVRALTTRAEVPPVEPGEAPLGRFLARVARNAVIDAARAIRAAKRDGSALPLARSDWSRGAGAGAVAAAGAGPATLAGLRETERSLVAAFRRLSPDHRRVLGLRQFEGLSAARTGERMGRSEEAIHSLYRRALLAWEEGARTAAH